MGTNGKGTTAVALAGALEAAGVRSGAYLSPHLLSYTERIMLGGNRVSEQDFAAVMGGVMTLANRHEVPATQFELLTAGALKLFRDRGAEWACLEAGLGARHDATSVTRSELVALTKLGLDHTEHPGSSVEEIAREKLASLRDCLVNPDMLQNEPLLAGKRNRKAPFCRGVLLKTHNQDAL